MLSNFRPARFLRGALLVCGATAALSFGAVAQAMATDATPSTTATHARSVVTLFGVPFSTAAWALLGVLLLVSGLLAASRSAARSAVSIRPAAAADHPATPLPAPTRSLPG